MVARNDHDALVHAAAIDFFAVSDFFEPLVGDAFFAAFLTLAQRAFWAATMLARPSELMARFFVLFACESVLITFVLGDAATVLGAD